MQESYPHEIRHFADGDTVPDGYVKLTDEEFRELDAMTPDERAAWFKIHKPRGGLDDLKEILASDKVERDADRQHDRELQLERALRLKKSPQKGSPYGMNRKQRRAQRSLQGGARRVNGQGRNR